MEEVVVSCSFVAFVVSLGFLFRKGDDQLRKIKEAN